MADASCPGFVPNPDLVGIGTRINFYATIFLGAIIPRHKYTVELLDELYINAVFYSLALLLTVLSQTANGQLDLYHAIFVMHLLAGLAFFQVHGMNLCSDEDLQSAHQRGEYRHKTAYQGRET
jgi:hypothetical protein